MCIKTLASAVTHVLFKMHMPKMHKVIPIECRYIGAVWLDTLSKRALQSLAHVRYFLTLN